MDEQISLNQNILICKTWLAKNTYSSGQLTTVCGALTYIYISGAQ